MIELTLQSWLAIDSGKQMSFQTAAAIDVSLHSEKNYHEKLLSAQLQMRPSLTSGEEPEDISILCFYSVIFLFAFYSVISSHAIESFHSHTMFPCSIDLVH